MTDLHAIFAAGRVRRWHTYSQLSWTDDYNDGHQGRCARLALAMFPDDRDLLAYMLTHDDGEYAVGDIARGPKRNAPGVVQEWLAGKECVARNMLWDELMPHDTHGHRSKLCDSLDAYMWMMHKAPQLAYLQEWRNHRAEIEALAITCNVADMVLPVIGRG